MIKHLLLGSLIVGQLCNPLIAGSGFGNRPVILQKWKENDSGWWYEYDDGSYPYNTFAVIDGITYYFNANGYMVTGWYSIGGKWYFFNPSGAMKKNAWEGDYYLKADGAMAVSEWIGKYYVGSDGRYIAGYGTPKWRQNSTGWWYDDGYGNYPANKFCDISGRTYYFNANGYMVTGWHSIGGKWYFFDSSGAMKKNAWEGNYFLKSDGTMAVSEWVDGNRYYVGSDGSWIENYGSPHWVNTSHGWKYDLGAGKYISGQFSVINGTKYYFDNNGIMATGWKKIGNDWFYFSSSGAAETGWVSSGSNWYYMDAEGKMKTGFVKDSGYWYYLSSTGAMCTGWVKDNNKWYYFDGSGRMKTGWIMENGYWYYLGSDGAMLTGNQNINGKTYHLNETTGAWDDGEADPKFYRTDSLLIIANKTHRLPDGYEPSDLVIPNVRKTGANPYLKSPAAAALEQMFNAASSQGVYLVLGSGYRSQSTQAAIYNNYVARDGQAAADRYSARPGYSEHQTGLAVDISDYYGTHYLSESFAYTAEAKWLYNNAHKYGFIMRYPQGKEYITGYMYEPWHFRYVGVSTATSIYNSGLTVEEYYGISGGTSY